MATILTTLLIDPSFTDGKGLRRTTQAPNVLPLILEIKQDLSSFYDLNVTPIKRNHWLNDRRLNDLIFSHMGKVLRFSHGKKELYMCWTRELEEGSLEPTSEGKEEQLKIGQSFVYQLIEILKEIVKERADEEEPRMYNKR